MLNKITTETTERKELVSALNSVISSNFNGNEYAVTYANACLTMGRSKATILSKGVGVAISHEKTGLVMEGKELKVQLLYILSNLAPWRGEEARKTKKTLKKFV